jgi:hypothetical protein
VNLYQKVAKVVDNANLVTGYSLVPNYASMFRLAGENDAESIFEIQGTGSIPAKELQDILILKVLVVPAVGDGVSIHLLKV